MSTLKKQKGLWGIVLLITLLIGVQSVTAQVKTQKTPEEIVAHIIENHPSEKISRDFRAMVEAGTFLLNKQTDNDPNMAATFFINADGKPVMGFAQSILLRSDIRMERLMVFLYHEYRHYEQWCDNLFPGITHEIKPDGYYYSEQEVVTLFRGEMDAYRVSNGFAAEQGWTGFDAGCEIYNYQGRLAFALDLAEKMSSLSKFAPHRKALLKVAQTYE